MITQVVGVGVERSINYIIIFVMLINMVWYTIICYIVFNMMEYTFIYNILILTYIPAGSRLASGKCLLTSNFFF